MSALTVNLKLIYQPLGVWLWVFILVCGLPMVLVIGNAGNYTGYVLLSALVGFYVASVQKEVLAKPFAFSLPGHRNTGGRFVLCCCGVANVLFGLQFLWYPEVTWGTRVGAVLAAAAVGMTMSLLVGWGILAVGNTLIRGILGAPLFVGIVMSIASHKRMEHVILSRPMLLIVAAACICGILVWLWQRQRDGIAREICGQMYLGMFYPRDRDKQRRYREAQAAKKWSRKGERDSHGRATAWFFQSRMARHGFLSTGRSMWGELYAYWGRVRTSSLWLLICVCMLLVVTKGAVPTFETFGDRGIMSITSMMVMDMLLVLLGSVAAKLEMPEYCSLLLPGGRREKYLGALLAAGVITLLGTVVIAAAMGISHVLEMVLPTFSVRGVNVDYSGVSLELLYFCPVVMPIGFLTGMLSRRRSVWIHLIAMFVCIGVCIGFMALNYSGVLALAGQPAILAAVAVSWLSFVAVLRRRCMSGDLVGAGG